jgi:hypothetical protein
MTTDQPAEGERTPLSAEAFDFWFRNDPTCPLKVTGDGSLVLFLANDYAMILHPGGAIGCSEPDGYQFHRCDLLPDFPMEGNVLPGERPR